MYDVSICALYEILEFLRSNWYYFVPITLYYMSWLLVTLFCIVILYCIMNPTILSLTGVLAYKHMPTYVRWLTTYEQTWQCKQTNAQNTMAVSEQCLLLWLGPFKHNYCLPCCTHSGCCRSWMCSIWRLFYGYHQNTHSTFIGKWYTPSLEHAPCKRCTSICNQSKTRLEW